jgi:hypothetical protein
MRFLHLKALDKREIQAIGFKKAVMVQKFEFSANFPALFLSLFANHLNCKICSFSKIKTDLLIN